MTAAYHRKWRAEQTPEQLAAYRAKATERAKASNMARALTRPEYGGGGPYAERKAGRRPGPIPVDEVRNAGSVYVCFDRMTWAGIEKLCARNECSRQDAVIWALRQYFAAAA